MREQLRPEPSILAKPPFSFLISHSSRAFIHNQGGAALGVKSEPLYPSFSPFIYAIISNTNYSIHKIHFLQEENDEASGNCDDC